MTSTSKYLPKPSSTLRLASLNLLYKSLNLELRLNSLIEELKIINCDVLCLQEVVSANQYPVIERLSEELGFIANFAKLEIPEMLTGALYGPAILSKIPEEHFGVMSQSNLHLDGFITPQPIITSSFLYNGYTVYIINTHLTWGSHATGARTRQVERISQYARGLREIEPQAVILLAGDLNCAEESTPIRFLKGLTETSSGENTLWVDAWGASGSPANAITNDPTMPLATTTAQQRFGFFDTNFTPKRRIDYIFAYEWCYGRPGYPLTFERFADDPAVEISDHFGIYSDIFLPNIVI